MKVQLIVKQMPYFLSRVASHLVQPSSREMQISENKWSFWGGGVPNLNSGPRIDENSQMSTLNLNCMADSMAGKVIMASADTDAGIRDLLVRNLATALVM